MITKHVSISSPSPQREMNAREKTAVCLKMADHCNKLEIAMGQVASLFNFKHKSAIKRLHSDIERAIELQSGSAQ
jgi:hypothetical protein